jgi:hypothetical protein
MFLHIGKNFVIPVKDIIAFIDLDTCKKSTDTKKFIDSMEKRGLVYKTDKNDIKTYILTCNIEKDKKTKKYVKKNIVYTSSISSATLFKRNSLITNI